VGFSQYAAGNQNQGFGPIVIPTNVEIVTVGTILKVEPRIADDGTVLMDISAEDSTAESVTIISGDRASTVPQKRENRAETQVIVNDGHTIVIGGLRSDSFEDDETRVPILGEVPLIGRLFKSTEKKRQERELLIFLTPRIVGGETMPEAKRIADTDAIVAEKMRHFTKPLWERVESKLKQGRDEVLVAIGESGRMYSEGHYVTLDTLRTQLERHAPTKGVTLVIRAHPRASQDLIDAIAQLATDIGMTVERDNDALPFVPAPSPTAPLPPLEPLPTP
jgi:hypothetical protein